MAPYIAEFGKVTKGKHTIKVKLFGNRENTFGNPHRIVDGNYKKYNWDVGIEQLSLSYRFDRLGVLAEPILLMK